MVRLLLEDDPIMSDRLIQLSDVRQRVAQIIVDLDVVGTDPQCGLIMLDGLWIFLLPS